MKNEHLLKMILYFNIHTLFVANMFKHITHNHGNYYCLHLVFLGQAIQICLICNIQIDIVLSIIMVFDPYSNYNLMDDGR